MAIVRFDENPLVTDTVLIPFETTDADNVLIDPYAVDKVIIYFLERNYSVGDINKFADINLDPTGETNIFYTSASPIKVYGTDGTQAWLSSDTTDAVIEKVDLDEDGNPLVGSFQINWTPEIAREGDYFVCWTWTPLIAGQKISNYLRFTLNANIKTSTSIPTHRTVPGKYETLLDLYLPETYKTFLSDQDVTPDVLNRLNLATAKGFSFLEDFVNQILDLSDANVVNEALLPYLANLFSWKLKSNKSALWRRQIKRAIPLFKKKGTYSGLVEALEEANIQLTNLTQYWQIQSNTIYTEHFIVDESIPESFVLTKVPLDPLDLTNFELSIRLSTDADYQVLTEDYVSFDTVDGITTMTWLGDSQLTPISLMPDDIIKVTYAYATVTNQTNEDAIKDLPLMDQRDERDTCYPLKNWNVKLIADSDAMFETLIPTRHPFHDDVIFGKVRTEFPYSENIYNMEEYNGSTRDSTQPCDIDLYFIDKCSACLSSNISLDVEVNPLTNDRIEEAKEVCGEFLPFHAVVHSINFNGGFEESLLPPVEEVEVYITNIIEDNVITGNMDFNRSIQPDIVNMKRNMLATASSVASASNGKGYNLAISLYHPAFDFDPDFSGLNVSDNLLEILSGSNSGEYTVSNPNKSFVDINEVLTSPFDSSAFPFNLSNKLYDGGVDVFQDDYFVFSDANTEINFAQYNIVSELEGTPWKIVVTSGPYAGTYTIHETLPDNTLVVNNWPTGNTTGLNYDLRTDTNVVVFSSVTGKVQVTNRGRLESSTSLVEQYGIQIGDYLYYSGNAYKVIDLINDTDVYLLDWNSGTMVGIPSVTFYRRIISSGVGYLNIRGMNLTTVTNHYTTLGVSSTLEDNNHLENFMVLINTTYYQISSWSDTTNGEGRYEIILNGLPVPQWGTVDMGGTTGVVYSIIQFAKTSPVTIGETTIDRIDRRGNEVITSTVETAMPMFLNMAGPILNSSNRGQPFEFTGQNENITFEIEWKEEPSDKDEV